MDNFTPIVCQLSCFGWGNDRYESCCGHFPRIRREDPVNFFPYLQFGCRKTDGQEGRKQICVSPAYLTEQGTRDGTEEACRTLFLSLSVN